MFKRTYIVAFFIACVAAAWLVALQRQETLRASIPLENRTAMVQLSSDSGRTPPQRSTQRAKIIALPGEIFLKTIDMNIDEDEDFEQVIIAKQSAASSALSLSVADFSPTLGIYTRSFDGLIAATKLESIIIQPVDVTGDGLSDLVVQGLDASNNQTLTIFRRLAGRGYSRIFSQSGISVSLGESTNAVWSGDATTIIVRKAAHLRGMLEETLYTWNLHTSSFQKSAQKFMKDSESDFSGIDGTDAQSFEVWLSRLWARTDTPSDPRYFYLDRARGELILGESQLQQRWIIKSADRNGNRLYITCSLSESSDLDRVVTIDAKARDTIALGVIDQQVSHFRHDEGWSGTYTVSNQTPIAIEEVVHGIPPTAQLKVSAVVDQRDYYGRYLGNHNSVLVLSEDKSILVLNKKYFEGVSRLFQYGENTVLDFQQVLPGGLTGARLIFTVSISRASDGSIAQLRLDSAQIELDGIHSDYRTPYLFTKTS